MNTYFNIRYELDIQAVQNRIDEQLQREGAQYICVADGNILQMVHNDLAYREVVNASMLSLCDSKWVPLFLKRLYGISYQRYCGSQIFEDLVGKKRYRQFFLGTSENILEGLRTEMSKVDPSIAGMTFYAPPFCNVDEFDYPAIAEMINRDNPDIIWVAMGAPKQECFMNRLQPYLKRGVLIGVGAVFNFYCGLEEAHKRAPKWMIDHYLEFVYRVFSEPRKQLQRCWNILMTFPRIYWAEKSNRK